MSPLHRSSKSADQRGPRHYWLLYTICFVLVGLLVYSGMVLHQRSFIWRPDGWHQHYRALVYYGQYLRRLGRSIIEGRPSLQEWDFVLGEGSDVLSTFHYYVIGDPFTVGAALVPTSLIPEYYTFSIVLRLYAAGIAYANMCFGFGQRNRTAVLVGSLAYAFCGWNLINSCRHPFFVNPTVYLPLLVWGIERIIQGKRPHVFVGAVLVATLSNFYFLFMLTILTLLYLFGRLVSIARQDFVRALSLFGRICLYAIFGVGMGCVIFVPFLYTVLSSTRIASGTASALAYPISYYLSLPSALMAVTSGASNYWLYFGMSSPVTLATALAIRHHREHRSLVVILAVCVVFTLFPFFGSLFNAMSYPANRWCWMAALPMAYALTSLWESFGSLDEADRSFLARFCTGYVLVCILFEQSRTIGCYASLGIAVAFALRVVVQPAEADAARRSKLGPQLACALLVVAGVVCNALFFYSPSGSDYATQLFTFDDARSDLHNNESQAVMDLAEQEGRDDFYRYSGRKLTTNGSVPGGPSSTQFYWSFAGAAVSEYRALLGLVESRSFEYRHYDDRTELLSLACVDYFAVKSSDYDPLPYGIDDEGFTWGSAIVHHNDLSLPLAYAYTSYQSRGDWEARSFVDKQASMLEGVVLEQRPSNAAAATFKSNVEEIPYTIAYDEQTTSLEGSTVITSQDNATITLSFAGKPDCVTYVELDGLAYSTVPALDRYEGNTRYDPLDIYSHDAYEALSLADRYQLHKRKILWDDPDEANLTFQASDGVKRNLAYYTPSNRSYTDRHDFLITFGYADEARSEVTITFERLGRYDLDAIRVLCQPTDRMRPAVEQLRENAAITSTVGTDGVTSQVTCDRNVIVCFSIPYSTGWKATVDGSEAPLLKANVKNMALELGPGTHEVHLVYHTPYLRTGFVISLLSFVAYLALMLLTRGRRREEGSRHLSQQRPEQIEQPEQVEQLEQPEQVEQPEQPEQP